MTNERSSWAVGWSVFAAVWMWILGFFHAITGLTGVVKDDIYVATPKYIFQFDVTTWGWVHLILGVVVFMAGFAVMRGAVWGRTVGVIIAVLSMLINFAWLPYYPVWGLLMIAANSLVIWALTAHGRDVAA